MRRLADYSYDLPPEQIAQTPVRERDASRLLWLADRGPVDLRFRDLPAHLPADSVVVVNDTAVIPARLRARKDSGGAVELLLIEPADGEAVAIGRQWLCWGRASKPIRPGSRLVLEAPAAAPVPGPAPVVEVVRSDAGRLVVDFGGPAPPLLERWGEVPLPPYIARPAGVDDRQRYQTIFARQAGAVAAPTAGLHFTPQLLAALEARGCRLAAITLHVGPGTFAPVRDDDLDAHRMHAERYHVPEATAALVASGRPVVAVGTTVVRALESAALAPRSVRPGPGTTELFIRPGFRFRVVDHLVTNFHLPASTLLMLVSALGGHARVMAAYRHAVAAGYRFYSYGDAMLLARDGGQS
jgi:S-adenosylmethionine:tRNA ribosyltransferase-isomerase